MKKLVLLAAMVLSLFVAANAQLNVQPVEEYEGYTILYTFKNMGVPIGAIVYIKDCGYVLLGRTDNQFEEKMASIFLGKTQDEAGRTIADLSAFYLNAKDGIYIVNGVSGAKTRITLTKCMGKRLIGIKTDGVAGESGVAYWICAKDKVYEEVLHAIYGFNEETLQVKK